MSGVNEIWTAFLDFFETEKRPRDRPVFAAGARRNDPTLLFTNAGMNQFKDVFLGMEKRDYTRATLSQKCVRAGGKHNDLDNVGYTRRHHTFFEMLGNFSFGDYFKAEAIDLAWTLLTKKFALPKDRLYVTVFREDDEAEELWQKVAGVPKDRIFRSTRRTTSGRWATPAPAAPARRSTTTSAPAPPSPATRTSVPQRRRRPLRRNLESRLHAVQQDVGGNAQPLPRPSIDTGMGLERVGAVMQGKLIQLRDRPDRRHH